MIYSKKVICITGIDGCGKTTQIRRLAKWLEESGFPPPPVLSVWEIAKNPRYQNHPFISDRKAVHQYLSQLHGGARALFVFHALLESLALTEGSAGNITLADGFWHKYAFTEHLHGEDIKWLSQVAGRFPRPVLSILLDIEPQAAWKRKPAVTAYECGFQKPSEEDFIVFQTKLRLLFLEISRAESWESVNGERGEEEVFRDIVQSIQNTCFTGGTKWT